MGSETRIQQIGSKSALNKIENLWSRELRGTGDSESMSG